MLVLQSISNPGLRLFALSSREFLASQRSLARKELDLYSYLKKFLRNQGEPLAQPHEALWLPMFRLSVRSSQFWFGRQLYAKADLSCHSEYFLPMSRR